MSKAYYKGPTVEDYAKRLESISELYAPSVVAMRELCRDEPDSDRQRYDSFLVKVYECGQAKYLIQGAMVRGKWDGDGFEFVREEKGQEPQVREVRPEPDLSM